MSRLFDLPLFPLSMVIYPDQQAALHIFEPRYQEMVQDCLEHEMPFGLILYEEGKMAEVGCTAVIQEVVQDYGDGRLDIVVEGAERFRVDDLRQEKAYLTADVQMVDDADGDAEDGLTQRVITQHMRLLELAGRTVRPGLYSEVPSVSFVIAHNAGLTLPQKQEVLELRAEDERILYLVKHLETLIPRVEEVESVREKVTSNGHFPDFPIGG